MQNNNCLLLLLITQQCSMSCYQRAQAIKCELKIKTSAKRSRAADWECSSVNLATLTSRVDFSATASSNCWRHLDNCDSAWTNSHAHTL